MQVRIVVYILLLSLISIECKKNSDPDSRAVCGVKDPISNLPWLKAKVDELRGEGLSGFVRSYDYRGQQILSIQAAVQSCFPCALYTCNGRQLNAATDEETINAVMENINQLEIIAEF